MKKRILLSSSVGVLLLLGALHLNLFSFANSGKFLSFFSIAYEENTKAADDSQGQMNFLTSSNALSMPCAGNAGDIGGTVFQDAENDGEKLGNPGQPGIVVRVFDCSGAEVSGSPTITDSNGDWTITGLTVNEEYQVEFTFPADGSLDYLQPSITGIDNGSDVQFVSPMMSDCTVDYGVFDPSYCTTTAPDLIVPCYVNGNPLPTGNEAYNQPALIKIPYAPPGDEGGSISIAQSHEIGSVYGVAQHRRAKKVFVGAVLRRHMGFGPDGSGAIYVMDEDGSNLSLFLDLNQGGISTGNITRDVSTGGTNPSRDADAFDGVGKTSLGDIELSADEQTLWVMNLEERTLLEIPLGNDPDDPTAPAIGSVIEHAWPNPGCTNGVFRAWGLKFYQGQIYIGGVCTAENSGSPANLVSYVYAHDPAGVNGNWSQVVAITDMDHDRGFAIDIDMLPSDWQAWSDTWPSVSGLGGINNYVYQPQPILSDIEITREGNMILGFMDRFVLSIVMHGTFWDGKPKRIEKTGHNIKVVR
ncbi:MAG: SdrD B-like domain-containing protein [Bacteroidota bacterium]